MDDTLQFLGLIYRAGKLVLGEEILKQIKKIRLLIIASDISEKSRQRLEKKAYYYQIPMINSYSSEQISSALGKNNVRVIGIKDEKIKQTLLNKIG